MNKFHTSYRATLLIGLLVVVTSVYPVLGIARSTTAQIVQLPIKTAPNFEVAFSPRQGATKLIVATIEQAKNSVYLAAYSFTSEPIARALIAAHQRGVKVKIVLDKSQLKEKNSVAKLLQQAKIAVRIAYKYSIMHNKFIIIDDNTLQLGSFNYTNSAESRNAENVLVINNCPELAQAYTEQWQEIWEHAK